MTPDHPFLLREHRAGALRELVCIALAGVFCAFASCTPAPAPAPIPIDGGDGGADECTLACQNLAALGCAEATPNCATVCRHIRATKLTPFDAECIATKTTKEAVRGCAGIRCE